MASSPEAQTLIDYVKQNMLMNAGADIAEDTPLVSSGLVDSFALIEMLVELERVTKRRISPGKVGAKDMDTVTLMLATAQRSACRASDRHSHVGEQRLESFFGDRSCLARGFLSALEHDRRRNAANVEQHRRGL